MAVLSVFLSCFMPSSESARVSDNNDDLGMKVSSKENFKSKSKSSSSGAPLVVHYFPSSTQMSRLQCIKLRNRNFEAEDKAKLLAMVKSDLPCGNNFQVIAVVGMGGIGKTTIAREVYNHKEPEGFKFVEKAWVCVSINFNILTISNSLLGSLKGTAFSFPSDLNGVQVELQKAVRGKKFLIVLDDVWEVKHNNWEKLTSPFKAGAIGSTMIVTTHHESVAKTIRCSDGTYHLPLLSNEACKSLFQEHALATSMAAYTDQITETIYEKVDERCSGLPLAAKILGGLLHS